MSLILCELACQSHEVPATCLAFTARVLCGGGRLPSVVRPRTLHVTPRLGISYSRQRERKRRRERERERERERGRESAAILAQVAGGNPRRLEPRWYHIRLNQLHILLGRHAGGWRFVPTSDVGAVVSSVRKMRQRRRRW